MGPFTVSAATGIVGFETNEAGHIVFGRISSVPTTGLDTTTLTYAAGCMIVESATGIIWVNVGTSAAPSWARLGSSLTSDPQFLQYQATVISAANIVATGVGQFGHANGVLLTPVAAAGFITVLKKVILSYTFGVAAYTAGGNITVNIGGGGAALTGLVSAANSVGAAASKIVELNPLAAAGNALSSAQSLNLVSTVAFTQPGTATGTIKVHTWYTVVPA